MARELRRLLVEPARLAAAVDGPLALQPAEAHYLGRVLRLRPGDRFAVIDGCGGLWSARLGDSLQARLEQPLAAPLERCPEPVPWLELLVVPPRRDLDLVLRMVCELGIDRLTLVRSERQVGTAPSAGRAEAILREACEQSERLWMPKLVGETPLPEALAASAGVRSLWATTRFGDLASLAQVLAALPNPACGVRLAIGPEGGWSPAEEDRARGCGWQPVSLGSTILRTSTAAVAAAAQLAAWRGEKISCAPGWRPSP